MTRKKFLSILLFITFSTVYAEEGMWLPVMLEGNIINQMNEAGLKLSAEDIYSTHQASLTSAIVGLGNKARPFRHFCTGGVVSEKGLVITNHHCAYGQIQKLSTLQNDYLKDGFWAFSINEEIPIPDLTMSFLIRMEKVTDRVLENINKEMSLKEQDSIIKLNIKNIENQAVEGTHYKAKVNDYFYGNEYYLSVYEIFEDIRLVGAPPFSIGHFGSDTDNWTWPRHSGDFAIFRIYASTDNKPAKYSTENIPFKPSKFLEISAKDIDEYDFTFVIGYPALTEQYLPSEAIKYRKDIAYPIRIKLRTLQIETMKKFTITDEVINIQYRGKINSIANSWKKWIGEREGMERFKLVERKQKLEQQFQQFATKNPDYENILHDYKNIYTLLTQITPDREYWLEGINRIEILQPPVLLSKFAEANYSPTEEDKNKTLTSLSSFYKNHNLQVDKELFKNILYEYDKNINIENHPQFYTKNKKRFKGDINKLADWLYSNTLFTDSVKAIAIVNNFSPKEVKKLSNDPSYLFYKSFFDYYNEKVLPIYNNLQNQLVPINKLYMQGLREMLPQKQFYPDANSTFRITYGHIKGSAPVDGIFYNYQTTLKGIFEKENLGNHDYVVPEKLKQLYLTSDFGKYLNCEGKLPLNFTATNHTTGGNSGSPVLDEKGRLIGLNFDRQWEGVMSDFDYHLEICRNIVINIRYALFIIDRFANAQNIIDELTIVTD